ncbi:aminotransferase class IV family protein [Weeksellaceae bacterium TAE3-ERU29]|nr:aminotransferase class IV family protein [Weeksellaceae bacterium TAE3-ERU29]
MDFLESIKVKDGEVYNLFYHQQRVNATFKNFFKGKKVLNLEKIISSLEIPQKGLYKLRVVYNDNKCFTEFVPYEINPINSLRLVTDNSIEYSFKSLDRNCLNNLKKEITEDEIIIVKNGEITDCSYANLAFWDGKEWFTPKSFLLNGTCRQRLLSEGKIKETKINAQSIFKYKKIGLINAMIDLEELVLDISKVSV